MSEIKEAMLKDLKQLYFLAIEIRNLEQDLAEMESKWRRINLRGGFMPSGETSDITGNTAASIMDCSNLIDKKVKELYVMKTNAERYIQSLDNPVLRTVIRLRFGKALTWNEVARSVGSHNKSTPFMMVKRFFDEDEKL